jgi:hypothetical protein
MSATIFVTSVVLAAWLVPLLAAALRAGLPEARRRLRALEPVAFGSSQKARRSPRHAVLLHRGLLGSFFMALVALALLPAATRLGTLGLSLIPVALAFALPALLVTLHARRRGQDG